MQHLIAQAWTFWSGRKGFRRNTKKYGVLIPQLQVWGDRGMAGCSGCSSWSLLPRYILLVYFDSTHYRHIVEHSRDDRKHLKYL